MKTLARIISFLTNPVFVLFPIPYLLINKFWYGHLYAIKWTIFSWIFLGVIGLFVYYEVKHKTFSDMDISKREQRPLFFFVSSAIAIIYFISLIILQAPPIFFLVVWGIIVSIIITSLITLHLKVSLHVATLTAVVLTIIRLYDLSLLLLLLLPLVGWARVQIKRHSMKEVLAGTGLGFAVTVCMYILLKYIYHFSL